MINKKTSYPSLIKVILAFSTIYIIWGSTYLGILIAIETIPPFIMVGTRFLVAGLILFLICRLKKYELPSAKLIFQNSLSGILMLYGGTGAVVWVEQYISSGLTAILIAAAPLWYVVLDKHLWGFHLKNKKIILGILIGLVGVALLVSDKTTFNFSENIYAVISIFVLIAGNIFWVIGSLFIKYNIKGGSPPMNASVQMISAGVGLLITALCVGEPQRFVIGNVTWQSAAALLYLVVFGSLVAYSAFVWLLTIRPPSIVGTHALVNPVVAVLLGWMLVGEQFNTIQIFALVIILAGVVLVNFTKVRKEPTD